MFFGLDTFKFMSPSLSNLVIELGLDNLVYLEPLFMCYANYAFSK